MYWKFEKALDIIENTDSSLLLKGKWGLEREAQRVTKSGNLALTDHPSAFGNKLLNSEITTDFSESQLELITPPLSSVEEVYKYLEMLTIKVFDELKNEFIWPLSMPPRLPSEEIIPIAKFDDTPEGREKEIYRLGLANRYGKRMQMISGIHFNISFNEELIDVLHNNFGNGEDKGEFTDKVYFSMARNFLRYRWLLRYLYGASPSADHTFNSVIHNELNAIRKCCPECCNPLNNYKKYATSLRVSRFGYSNDEQNKFTVSYNSKSEYLQSIRKMMKSKSKKYSEIGIFKDGKQIQLNDNILQKESEFYSAIRLKQVPEKAESQLEALEERGVRYVEVRIIDINPYERVGISLEQMYFLQVFMLFCLFENSAYINRKELNLINKNHNLIAISGRKNNLKLYRYTGEQVLLEDWGQHIFGKLIQVAKVMDAAANSSKYQDCIFNEYKKLIDKSLLPSNKIINDMKLMGDTFITFGIRRAIEYRNQKV
jgi:glutamate--cysteine ligase